MLGHICNVAGYFLLNNPNICNIYFLMKYQISQNGINMKLIL